MSNYHLKDRRLSLKAKGLLTVMLSLPDNWNYTLHGLTAINQEGVDAIREAVPGAGASRLYRAHPRPQRARAAERHRLHHL